MMGHEAPEGKQYFSPVNYFSELNNKILLFTDKGTLEVTILSDRIIKFRLGPKGIFEKEFSYALSGYTFPNPTYTLKEEEDHFAIVTEKMVCRISKANLHTRMEDLNGNLFCEDSTGIHWEYSLAYGGNHVYCSKKHQPGEGFYGVGDKSTELNLARKKVTNWGSDKYGFSKDADPLYKNIPFYIGLHQGRGYGIFFDNTFRSHFDFGYENPDFTSFWAEGGDMIYYYIHGPNMLDVVEQYTLMTGTPEMPPIWSLGFHQCRWSYYPEARVREIADEFRKRQIPCDALYLDIDYMESFKCFTWNKEHFPKPKKMIEDLKKQGFRTVVIIDPGIKIEPGYPTYDEAIEKDYFCRRGDGPLLQGSVWPGLCHFPDFTRGEVRAWWGEQFQGLVNDGVDGIWNDMNEPVMFEGEFPDDVRFDYDGHPTSHRKAHNIYGMQMARGTQEGLKKLRSNTRPFAITRSGYAGFQRYACTWTGDNVSTWEHLKLASTMCQRLCVSGVSFNGSDVGGFLGYPDGELYTRWIQLGVFSPLYRTHSGIETKNQEPWCFGEFYEKICKEFIELRYKLLPYLYTAFWQYSTKGTPILRPITFLEQQLQSNHGRQDEFGYGDNLLVCPILEPSVTGRNMYFPEGKWYRFGTSMLHEGGEDAWVHASIDAMPIFAKAGSVIPLAEVMQYTNERTPDTLTLQVYYKVGKHTSVLYEDAGEGYEYQSGAASITHFHTEGTQLEFTMSIEHVQKGYKPGYTSYKVEACGLPSGTEELTIDGKFVNFKMVNGVMYFDAPLDFKLIRIR